MNLVLCTLSSLPVVFPHYLLSFNQAIIWNQFALCVKPGGDNDYGRDAYYADAFHKQRWILERCIEIIWKLRIDYR